MYLIMQTYKGEPREIFISDNNGFSCFDGIVYHEIANVRYFEIYATKDEKLEAYQKECLLKGFQLGCFDNVYCDIDVGELRTSCVWESKGEYELCAIKS